MEGESVTINGILKRTASTRAQAADEGCARKSPSRVAEGKSSTLLLLSLKAPCLCRHLLNDIQSLLQETTARDSKMKSKFSLAEVLEIADMKDAENVLLIETRKREPLPYCWLVTRSGEEGREWDVMKFSITGVFTMQELKMPGNPFSSSQMITVFSEEFERTEGWKRVKRALTRIFNSTEEERGKGPIEDSVDKVASFFIIEGTVVARFYHVHKRVVEPLVQEASGEEKENGNGARKKKEAEHRTKEESLQPRLELREVGPRFTLIPRESDIN